MKQTAIVTRQRLRHIGFGVLALCGSIGTGIFLWRVVAGSTRSGSLTTSALRDSTQRQGDSLRMAQAVTPQEWGQSAVLSTADSVWVRQIREAANLERTGAIDFTKVASQRQLHQMPDLLSPWVSTLNIQRAPLDQQGAASVLDVSPSAAAWQLARHWCRRLTQDTATHLVPSSTVASICLRGDMLTRWLSWHLRHGGSWSAVEHVIASRPDPHPRLGWTEADRALWSLASSVAPAPREAVSAARWRSRFDASVRVNDTVLMRAFGRHVTRSADSIADTRRATAWVSAMSTIAGGRGLVPWIRPVFQTWDTQWEIATGTLQRVTRVRATSPKRRQPQLDAQISAHENRRRELLAALFEWVGHAGTHPEQFHLAEQAWLAGSIVQHADSQQIRQIGRVVSNSSLATSWAGTAWGRRALWTAGAVEWEQGSASDALQAWRPLTVGDVSQRPDGRALWWATQAAERLRTPQALRDAAQWRDRLWLLPPGNYYAELAARPIARWETPAPLADTVPTSSAAVTEERRTRGGPFAESSPLDESSGDDASGAVSQALGSIAAAEFLNLAASPQSSALDVALRALQDTVVFAGTREIPNHLNQLSRELRDTHRRAELLRAAGLIDAARDEWAWWRRDGIHDPDSLAVIAAALAHSGQWWSSLAVAGRSVRAAGSAVTLTQWRLAFPLPSRGALRASDGGIPDAVPLQLFAALIHQESHWSPQVVSPVGAVGLTQVMPATGQQLAPSLGRTSADVATDLRTPAWNLRYGRRYLRDRLARAPFAAVALAGYNAGPTRAVRWARQLPRGTDSLWYVERIPFEETRTYVQRITVGRQRYRVLWNLP